MIDIEVGIARWSQGISGDLDSLKVPILFLESNSELGQKR